MILLLLLLLRLLLLLQLLLLLLIHIIIIIFIPTINTQSDGAHTKNPRFEKSGTPMDLGKILTDLCFEVALKHKELLGTSPKLYHSHFVVWA